MSTSRSTELLILYNNIAPSAVDKKTLGQLNYMLETIHNYRMLSEKRERLEYIYDNNKAAAIRSAIPNPIGVLNLISSKSKEEAIVSALYLVTDSVTGYVSHKESIELQYLKDGWALDDEEMEAIDASRRTAYNYMMTMCQDKGIPDDYVLPESAIQDFVEAKNKPLARRIQFLEYNQEKYKCLGSYWILLAESYFDNGDYKNCIDAISVYEELAPQIYRKDKEYAAVLPKVIVAAKSVLPSAEFIKECPRYCDAIIENSDENDWAIQYFAALTYLDLYKEYDDTESLKKSYEITKNSVRHWAEEQGELNARYLADVVKLEVPKDATKQQKKEIKSYNSSMKTIRKTELPPICEPLYLNCELLAVLADECKIDAKEKKELDSILYADGDSLFLTRTLESCFAFSQQIDDVDIDAERIEFDGNVLKIPAYLVSEGSTISMTIKNGTESIDYDDWTVRKVTRTKDGITTFVAEFTSENAKKYQHEAGENISITVRPREDSDAGMFSVEFTAKAKTFWNYQTGIHFERVYH